MVVAPCRRLVQAARWNGQAPQTATGEARVRLIHCQLSNWVAGTIASTSTGRASAALIRNRDSSAAAWSAGSVRSPVVVPVVVPVDVPVDVAEPTGGSDGARVAGPVGRGIAAVYPVRSTVAIRSAGASAAGKLTCAV